MGTYERKYCTELGNKMKETVLFIVY